MSRSGARALMGLGSLRLIRQSNPLAWTKCHQPLGAKSVGDFYTFDRPLCLSLTENGSFWPFLQIGTPIATFRASTWSHANERDGERRFLVPLHRPFLFVRLIRF